MRLELVIVGLLIVAFCIFKHYTKIAIGRQLINLPGAILAAIGVVVVILGLVMA